MTDNRWAKLFFSRGYPRALAKGTQAKLRKIEKELHSFEEGKATEQSVLELLALLSKDEQEQIREHAVVTHNTLLEGFLTYDTN